MSDTTDLSPERIARFLAVAEKATPGKWIADGIKDSCWISDTGEKWVVFGCWDNAQNNVAFIAAARTMAPALAEKVQRLRAALGGLVQAVDNLIGQSEGVYGLHLNGDPAPWNELTEGGRFEEWLLPLEEAREVLKGIPT